MTDNLQPWSASATAGVAYSNAIQADLYSNANGRIRFNSGKQGEMRFVFDVTGLDGEGILGPDFYRMRMTYSNAGRSAPAVVETVLKRVSSTSGNISNLASVTSANQPQRARA